MGATAAGAGGSFTGCTVNDVALSGSSPGQAGSGADGGAGGAASGFSVCCGIAPGSPLGGAGGGGGGGYFGGGGGATGASTCSPTPCAGHTSGEGGGAGSSFVSDAIEYPTFTFATAVGDVFIEFWPVIEIDTPANGAVYSPGQVVNASWVCASYSSGPGGCNSSSGTVPSGSPINATPGTHTFTVNGKVNVTGNGSQPVSATVTYTVKAATVKPPKARITKTVISSKHHSAKFTFSVTGATGSPKAYKHLKAARYTFYVRAASSGTAGTAASKSFTIS
jgi:hypothetical protein